MCDLMRPRRYRRIRVTLGCLALLTGVVIAALIDAGKAHADTPIEDYLRHNGYLICQIITNRPESGILNGMVEAIEAWQFWTWFGLQIAVLLILVVK